MLIDRQEQFQNETCRRLIEAASEEFAKRGYAGSRIRNIVSAAEVNLAAINYYFGGKQGLYRATLGWLAGRVMADFPQDTGERRGQSSEKRLARLVFAMLEGAIGAAKPSPLVRILAHETMDPSPHIDRLIEEMTRPQVERIRALVREIAGPAVPDPEVALAALSIAGQCLVYHFGRPAIDRIYPALTRGPDVRKRLARQITHFSLAGLAGLRRRWEEATVPPPLRKPRKASGTGGH
ncbi:MAG: CerR family C-terminal domain-containing protein [Methylocella sp.]